MEFKNYYATLGVERSAGFDEIKRAYRTLARKHHPDLNKAPQAEARFKEVAEAHEALIDPERRAAYDDMARRQAQGQPFEPPPGGDSGFEFGERADSADAADHSAFFESLFGHAGRPQRPGREPRGGRAQAGSDHHAKVTIALLDAYRGAQRVVTLRMPGLGADGQAALHERQLEVGIPKGVREGQHLRLAGQGAPGVGGGPPGDLYLELSLRPQPPFRVDGGDIYVDLPLAPWEAALGADVTAPTPEGEVQLTIPAGSAAGRKLRLKGKGLPGKMPGDLYAVLGIALPRADSAAARAAYAAFATAFPAFDARTPTEA